MNKPASSAITKNSFKQIREQRESNKDADRNIKRSLGIIKQVDSQGNGKLFVFVDVVSSSGALRPFGQNKTPVAIIDSPLDLLLRFGGIRPGQLVEVFHRGIGETNTAYAKVIGDVGEKLSKAREIPKEGFSVAASLPFEPMGVI